MVMFRKSREHMRMQPIATKTFASKILVGRLGIAGLLLALGSLTSCYTHVAADDDYYAYHRPRHRAVVQQEVYDTVYAEEPQTQQVVDSTHGDTTFVTDRPRDDEGYGSAAVVNNYYDDPYWNAYWGWPYRGGWGLSFAFGAYDPFYVGYGIYDPFFTAPYYGGWYGPGPFWYPGFYHRWGWGYGGGGYYRGYDRGYANSGSGRFVRGGFGRINGGESRMSSYPLLPSGNGVRAMAPSSTASRVNSGSNGGMARGSNGIMSSSNGVTARSNASGSWPIGVVPNSVRNSNAPVNTTSSQTVNAGVVNQTPPSRTLPVNGQTGAVANTNVTGNRPNAVSNANANPSINAGQVARSQNMQLNANPASTGRHIVVVSRPNGNGQVARNGGWNGGVARSSNAGRAAGNAPARAYGGGTASGRSYGGGRSNGGGGRSNGGGRSSGGGGGHSGGGGGRGH